MYGEWENNARSTLTFSFLLQCVKDKRYSKAFIFTAHNKGSFLCTSRLFSNLKWSEVESSKFSWMQPRTWHHFRLNYRVALLVFNNRAAFLSAKGLHQDAAFPKKPNHWATLRSRAGSENRKPFYPVWYWRLQKATVQTATSCTEAGDDESMCTHFSFLMQSHRRPITHIKAKCLQWWDLLILLLHVN